MHSFSPAPICRRPRQAPSPEKIDQCLDRIASEMWTWLVYNRVFPSNSTGVVLQTDGRRRSMVLERFWHRYYTLMRGSEDMGKNSLVRDRQASI